MKRTNFIQAFHQLSLVLDQLGENKEWPGFEIGITENEYNDIQVVIYKQFHYNGWFTKESVRNSLKAWGDLLKKDKLESWLSAYSFTENPKRVGVIMAGNIPLVGMHDFVSVVLSGNKAVIKLSSDDKTLLPALISILLQFDPELKNYIEISPYKLGEIDAIIATGSNNSLNYFESYFGKYPHIFRKNRTSLAVLTGNETKEELEELGKDIFTYFGLGCRNVSKIFIPKDFDLNRFFEAIYPYHEIVNHHKYANNYDYNKAIYLMNLQEILDNHFVLLRESDELFSPLAMLFYQRYEDISEVENFIQANEENIQCIVGQNFIPFGEAQAPKLNDYADGVDTMKWLNSIS
ncbi:MAG: acyl-CoA reductase [Flavobacteriia bacterium]